MPETGNSIPRVTLASLAGIASVSLFFVTTQDQPAWTIASAIIPNLLVNTFGAHRSLSRFGEQLSEKKYCQFLIMLSVSLLLSVPYGLITYHEYHDKSKTGLPVRILAAFSAWFGQTLLNGLFFDNFLLTYRNYKRSRMLGNLNTMMGALQVVRATSRDLFSLGLSDEINLNQKLEIIADFVHASMASPKQASKPVAVLAQGTSYLLQCAFAMMMTLCALVYTCATDDSLKEKPLPGFNAWEGFATALTLMSPVILLCVMGGAALAKSIADKVSHFYQYRQLHNDFNIKLVMAAVIASVFAADSGFTVQKLHAECANTPIAPVMMFPGSPYVANASSAFFNLYFQTQCLLVFFNAIADRCVKKSDGQQNRLAIVAALDEVIRVVRNGDTVPTDSVLRKSGTEFRAWLWGVQPSRTVTPEPRREESSLLN